MRGGERVLDAVFRVVVVVVVEGEGGRGLS
jgi:hypothetical protein